MENATAFGVTQLSIAGAGFAFAVVALVQSARDLGRPWRWLLAAVFAYGAWGVLLVSVVR